MSGELIIQGRTKGRITHIDTGWETFPRELQFKIEFINPSFKSPFTT
jgi:hypothetical protein